MFRKIGLRISEFEECLSSNSSSLASILRRKEYHLEVEQKRKEVIELMVKKESQDIINGKIALIEAEESIKECKIIILF